ncbi:hypothetical protein RXV86_18250 [Alisedimentitalea sp. MJ-SS2]|uniref:hypothetical protein n=1 Tax=Aliisedimentitalea sp. MJ-SS2 TaxID=3049795 RepID=UPI002908063F|nr:hypothetical protein [Alisedimentitalea sp. MJ-SS2]MDU8929339.1 hypothetical protein [Alisedimentitalea sp. MJ-SS2]
MKSLYTILALTLGIATPAVSDDDAFYVSSGGDDYTISVNASGFVLTSRYPKARFVEQGTNSYVVRGIETFYFGTSCDASHEVFGTGKWSWANGGFRAEFEDGFILGFPRQELPEGHGSICRM